MELSGLFLGSDNTETSSHAEIIVVVFVKMVRDANFCVTVYFWLLKNVAQAQ